MTEVSAKPRAGRLSRITRVLALFFLFGFMITAVQLVTLWYAHVTHPGEMPIDRAQVRLSGTGAGINLLLAIVLFRISRRAR